jgi:hypothetical protein
VAENHLQPSSASGLSRFPDVRGQAAWGDTPLEEERTHDSLGRRLRDIALSTGKHITCEDADLIWFEAIHRLGHQTSAALYELTKHIRRDKQRALHRMRDLRHEEDSDYGGPTLLYPLQQERARRPDRNLNVYGVTKHAIEALKVSGRYREHAPTTNHNEWKHDFMGACVATSLYFGVREHPDRYEFIFEDQIVSRLGACANSASPTPSPRGTAR